MDSTVHARTIRILFLSANPNGMAALRTDREVREIQEALRQSEFRDRFELKQEPAVRISDLQRCLLQHRPDILHFSGHGYPGGAILLEGRDGKLFPLLSNDLAALLSVLKDRTRCIFLNSCYSAQEVEPIADVIASVIARPDSVKDSAAILFSSYFYQALAYGRSVRAAFDLGCLQLRMEGWQDDANPILLTTHCDPEEIRFAEVAGEHVPGDGARQALRHYLERMADSHRHLDLPSPSWLKAPPVAAADLFVEPRCRKQIPGTSRDEAAAPFDEVAEKERHLAILGEAGSGKTMLLRRFAVDLASRASQGPAEDAAFSFPGLIPVLVTAADLAAERRRSPSDLASCLGRCLSRLPGLERADVRALAAILPDLLEDGKVALLIDNLDEQTRLVLLQELNRFVESDGRKEDSPGPRLVVTSRTTSWPALHRSDRITRVVLEPFGTDEIERFLTAWNRSLGGSVDLTPIVQWIGRQKDRSLVECPWFLSLLCWLLQQGWKRIPRCRSELYAFVFDALFDAAIPNRVPLLRTKTLTLLAEIAAGAQERGEDVDARQVQLLLEHRMERAATEPSPEEISRVLLDNLGVLTPRGGGFYRFWHLGFQEYFAACFLEPEIRNSIDRLLERMAEPCWREPLRMAMGCAGLNDLAPHSRFQWLRSLIAYEDPQGPGAPRPALFLAATLAEIPEVPEAVVEELAERLLTCTAADAGRPPRQGPLEEAFLRLLAGDHAAAARGVLSEALRPSGDRVRALAAARLVRQAGRLAGDAADALPHALRHDEASPDRPVEAALRDLAAREPERLPSPPGSLRESLRRRESLPRNVIKDPAWLRLVLAVYGGFAPGAGFQVELIHRDSPLTLPIQRALGTNDPPQTLIPELERRLISSEPGAPFDAALALLALGGPALEKIPKDFFLEERHQARLAHCRDGLRPLAAAALAPCLEGLGKLASRCDPERWSALLAAVLRVGVAWSGPPAALFRLGSAGSTVPLAARSAVLAEIWHVPLVSQDPIYHFTLLLDLMGGALSSPPRLLADSLARAGNAVLAHETRHRGWTLQALEECPRSRRESLAAALDALAALAPPFDFVRGWALAGLAPLLAEEGLLSVAIHLATESLSDHFGARKDALTALRACLDQPMVPAIPESFSLLPHARMPSDDATLLLEHASDLTRPNGAGAPLLLAALLDRVPSAGLLSSGPIDATPPPPAGRLVSRGVLPLDLSLRWNGVRAEEAVSPLLDALEDTDDLRRHEALLALAGDRSDSQRSASAAALGPDVLSRLAQEWLAYQEYRPRTAQIIDWTLERVRHDDGEALAAWGHRLAHGQAMDAEVLLSRIHDLHPRAWPAFRDLLHTESLPLQRALLQSLCYLAARRRLSPERWAEIAGILGRWNGEAAQQEVYFPEGALAIARAVEAVFKAEKNHEAAVPAAESALIPFILPLSGEINAEHPKTLLERLAAAGSVRVTPARRRETVALAADRLARRPEVLPILLAWTVHRLKNGPQDPSPLCPVTGSLLGVVAAVADRIPDDFRRAADSIPDLDRWLYQAVEAHDSYFGRRAALEILAFFRHLTPATVSAVRSAIRDVPECQACALATATAFNSASSPAVKDLAQALHDPSALTVHTTAMMATALARSGLLQAKERDLLTAEAQKAMETSGAKEVWTLAIDGKLVRPQCLGRLGESLTSLLLELAGLGLLHRGGAMPAPNIEREVKGSWLDGEIGGRREQLPVYIGRPALGLDPLKYQKAWLTEVLGVRNLSTEVKGG